MSIIDGDEIFESLEPIVLYFPPPIRKGVKSCSKDKIRNYNVDFMATQPINYQMPTIIITEPREIIDPKKNYESDENIKKCKSHKIPNIKKNPSVENNNNIKFNKKNIQNNLNIIEQPNMENSDISKSFNEINLINFSNSRSSKNISSKNTISSKKKLLLLNLSKDIINTNENESEKENHHPKKEMNSKLKKNRIKKKKSSHNYNPKKKSFVIDRTVISKRKQSCCVKIFNDVKYPYYLKMINDLQKKSKDKSKIKNNTKNDFIDKEIFRIKATKNVETKNKDQKKSNEDENSPSESILSDDESSNTSRKTKQISKNLTVENNNNINSKKEKNLKNKHEKEREKTSVLHTNPNNKKENKKNNKTKITIVTPKINNTNNDKDDDTINQQLRKKKFNKEIDFEKIRKRRRSSTLKYRPAFQEIKNNKVPSNPKINSINKIGEIDGTKNINIKIMKKNDEKRGEESDSEESIDKNSKQRIKKINKKTKIKNSKKKEKKADNEKLNMSNYSSKSSVNIKTFKTKKNSLFSKENKGNSKKEVKSKLFPIKEKTIDKNSQNQRNSSQLANAPAILSRRTVKDCSLTKIVEESAKIVESRLLNPNEGPNIVPFTNITSVTLDYKEYKEYTLNCLEVILDLEKNKKESFLSQINFNFSGEELNKKKIALFDIDETLIHCTGNIKIKGNVPHQKEIMINLPNNQKVKVGINIRPFWQEALDMLIDKYNIVAYTASHQAYADSVLDSIDPKKKYFKHRLYRNNCASTEVNGSKLYIKDLDILKENYNLKDIVIIDNSVLSFAYHLNNGIPIVPYYEGSDDKYLLSIAVYLSKIWDCDDLREKNKKVYNLEKWKDEIADDIDNKKVWSSSSEVFVLDPTKDKTESKK